MEENKENLNNKDDINNNENINDLPEPEITENEMKEIIDFINNWDYEKYERDSEVREALLLLRSKMKKEEAEKEKQLDELRVKEKNKKDDKEEEEFKTNKTNIIEPQLNSYEKINYELDEKEKELLEKNWNSSTKPEYGEKIVNEKGDKEIIINNDNKPKKVILILYLMFYNRKQKRNIILLKI